MRSTAYHSSRHLTDAELGPPLECCPICHATAPRRPIHRLQAEPLVELLACPCCRGASAARMPRAEVLDAYYGDYYAAPGAHVTVADPARFAARIARHLRLPAGLDHVRLLDFGGGDGRLGGEIGTRLLARGAARAVDIVLVDYEPPHALARKGMTITGRRSLDEVEGRFDVVLASAILEHVPDLHASARRLFGLVAAGGSLYARTPWMAPLSPIIPGLDLTFPAHVHDLGGEFWNRAIATFALDATLVASGPSPVESNLRTDPLRALAAHALKAPARIESLFRAAGTDPAWRWVGGWEAVLRFAER